MLLPKDLHLGEHLVETGELLEQVGSLVGVNFYTKPVTNDNVGKTSAESHDPLHDVV